MCFDFRRSLRRSCISYTYLVSVFPFTPLVKCELSYSLCAYPVSYTCLAKGEMFRASLVSQASVCNSQTTVCRRYKSQSHTCSLYLSGYPRAWTDVRSVVYLWISSPEHCFNIEKLRDLRISRLLWLKSRISVALRTAYWYIVTEVSEELAASIFRVWWPRMESCRQQKLFKFLVRDYVDEWWIGRDTKGDCGCVSASIQQNST